jgi:hypothetical protein
VAAIENAGVVVDTTVDAAPAPDGNESVMTLAVSVTVKLLTGPAVSTYPSLDQARQYTCLPTAHSPNVNVCVAPPHPVAHTTSPLKSDVSDAWKRN